MNEIKIRHELCEEDRARIDRLTEALEKYPRKCENCVQAVLNAMQHAVDPVRAEKTAAEATSEEAPTNTQASAETATEPTPVAPVTEETTPAPVPEKTAPAVEVPDVKLSDIQQKVVALSTAGKKTEVKAIVNEYAERVTLIPADKYGEVFAKLTALEG